MPAPAITPAKISVIQDDGDHVASILASVPEEELDDLAKSWLEATHADRRAFCQWVLKRPGNELCPDMSPDDPQRVGDVIVEEWLPTNAIKSSLPATEELADSTLS